MEMQQRLDILEALSRLKVMCASYDTCSNCPAYKDTCRIKDTDPKDYNLNLATDIWRAFK